MKSDDALKIPELAHRWFERLLAERFGHRWMIQRLDSRLWLMLFGAEGAIEFDQIQDSFADPRCDLPFSRWDCEQEGWKSVIGGPLPAPGVEILPKPLIESSDTRYVVHYDIPGLTYWMLARVEEIDSIVLDEFGRFPATASHAYRHGYLLRPVVDEWLNILSQVIRRRWPNIQLKSSTYKLQLSHDVDRPYQYKFLPPSMLAKTLLGDVVKRRSVYLALKRLTTWGLVKSNRLNADPYNTFDWIMQQSEKYGLKSAFYFICGNTNKTMDADYEIEHPVVRNLLRLIYRRGHEIGLHPSFNSYQKPAQIRGEFSRLKRVCEEEGISQKSWGGRMHYLRWDSAITMRAWNDAGLNYDSTLGYADHIGFRCGTCIEYPAFDAKSEQALNLRIRPLLAMDTTLISGSYMGLADDQWLQCLSNLAQAVESVGGEFTMLWHNSELSDVKSRNAYADALELLTKKPG